MARPILQESKVALPSVNAAKWLKVALLIDSSELENLFSSLKENFDFYFYQIQGIAKRGEGILSPAEFLTNYQEYIETLKKGDIPSQKRFQKEFCCAWSASQEALYALVIDEEREIIKPKLPVLHIQQNLVRYCKEDSSFRSQVYGNDCFNWGIQVSYPQLYQDNETHEIKSVQGWLNTELFKTFQKWIRHNTVATPFLIDGKKQNEPLRLGRACFSWVQRHAELRQLGISIYAS